MKKLIDDIYKAYNLPDNSNIIIVKYDIHNDTQEYLTNKVEYEFYTTDGRKAGITIAANTALDAKFYAEKLLFILVV